MKKLLSIAILLLILSSAGFAAKLSEQSAFNMSKLSVGCFGATPTLRYDFTDELSGQVGMAFASNAGTSAFSLLLAGQKDVMDISGNTVNMGGVFTAPNGSIWTAAFTCGVDTKLNKSLVLELKIWPVSLTSWANTTTIGILNTATVGAHLYL